MIFKIPVPGFGMLKYCNTIGWSTEPVLVTWFN